MTDLYLKKSMATPETPLPEGYQAAKDANRYHFGFAAATSLNKGGRRAKQ